MKTDMALFEDYQIRRVYDEDAEIWWFSVIDIVQVLTQQPGQQTARKYWNKLKQRLTGEGSQLVTNCHQLKLTATDGKQRLTDVATAEFLGIWKSAHNRDFNYGEFATIKSQSRLNSCTKHVGSDRP